MSGPLRPPRVKDLELAVAELVDVIEQLCEYSRVHTYDEQDGEEEAIQRATRLVNRYTPAS